MGDPIKRIERRSRRAIFQAYLDHARREKPGKVAITDGDGRRLTVKEITQGSFALGGALARLTGKGEHVGVLLPTGAGAVIGFFALLSRGRVPAMLNFTAGSKNLLAACRAAEVTKIVTAKKFVELAGLDKLIDELSAAVEIIHLEDVREQIGPRDKALALLGPLLPTILAATPDPEDPGVILFTSAPRARPKAWFFPTATSSPISNRFPRMLNCCRRIFSSIRCRPSIATA